MFTQVTFNFNDFCIKLNVYICMYIYTYINCNKKYINTKTKKLKKTAL